MRFGYENYDARSYQIGALECFAELVRTGKKRIALSGTLEASALPEMTNLVAGIAQAYGIKYYAEYNLVKNLIAEDSYVQDKYVFMLYRDDEAMEEYRQLKDVERQAVDRGYYDINVKKEITAQLCRLLSYPEDHIQEKYA